jgi:hypothetical protein
MNLFFHRNLFSDDRKFECKITSRLTQSIQKEQQRDLKEITKAERKTAADFSCFNIHMSLVQNRVLKKTCPTNGEKVKRE